MKWIAEKNNRLVTVIAMFVFLVFVFSYTRTGATQILYLMGQKPPSFSLKDIDEKTVTLSDYSNKTAVILLFWSTWSSKSKEALKRFNGYYQKYRDRGIQVIGINANNQGISDSDIIMIKSLIKELEISYPVVLDNGLETFYSYGIIALPSTVVISDNKISYALPGLPLVGTEKMFDYLLVLAGDPPRSKKVKTTYMPKYEAIATANLARKFAKKKNMSQMAYQLFKKAIKKDPRYMPSYIEFAVLYESDGKPKDAEAILREALSIDPENQIVSAELGFLLAKNGETKESLDFLRNVVQSELFPPAQYYFAYALGKDGQLENSLVAFDKAVEHNPFEYKIYLLRADIYESNNMFKEAAADYKKALQLILKIQD